MTQRQAEAMFPIFAVHFIGDKGESPDGPVKKLQSVLEQHGPGLNLIRPDISFYDPKRPADVAVKELLRTPIPEVPCWLAWVSAAWSLRDCRNSDVRTCRSLRLARPHGRMKSLLKAAQRGDSRSIRLKTRSSGQESHIGRSPRAFRKTWTGLYANAEAERKSSIRERDCSVTIASSRSAAR
jgi:hypothetical protein